MQATTDRAVAAAYDELVAALANADLDTLRARVADECRIVGPKGFLIDRSEWIDAHDAEVFQQVLLETVESESQVLGDTAVRLDLQRSECLFRGEPIHGLFRVMSVWRDTDLGWQLTAIQHTAVAAEATPDTRA